MWCRLGGDGKGPPAPGGKRRLLGSLFPREEFLVTPPGQPLRVPLLPSRQGPACTRRRLGATATACEQPVSAHPLLAQAPALTPQPGPLVTGDRKSLHLAAPSDQNILSGEDTALHWLSTAVPALGSWASIEHGRQ